MNRFHEQLHAARTCGARCGDESRVEQLDGDRRRPERLEHGHPACRAPRRPRSRPPQSTRCVGRRPRRERAVGRAASRACRSGHRVSRPRRSGWRAGSCVARAASRARIPASPADGSPSSAGPERHGCAAKAIELGDRGEHAHGFELSADVQRPPRAGIRRPGLSRERARGAKQRRGDTPTRTAEM